MVNNLAKIRLPKIAIGLAAISIFCQLLPAENSTWQAVRIRPRTIVFPEIRIDDKRLKNVPVEFFERTRTSVEVSSTLAERMKKASTDSPLPAADTPMVNLIGMFLLEQPHREERFVVALYEYSIISLSVAVVSQTAANVIQTLSGTEKTRMLFESDELSKELTLIVGEIKGKKASAGSLK